MKIAALSTAAAMKAAWLLPSVSAQDVNLVPLIDDVGFRTESFRKRDCNVVEGSLGNNGCPMPTDFQGWKTRKLLAFSTWVVNEGPDHLEISRQQTPEHFEWGACHKHWHFIGFTQYKLVKVDEPDSGAVIEGRKQAFCLMDIVNIGGVSGNEYTCSNQGISAGWADVYSSHLDGQHIDITGALAGDYELRVTINAAGVIDETDDTDNTVTVPITLPVGTDCDGQETPEGPPPTPATPPPGTPEATPPPDAPGPAPACAGLDEGCESAGECCSQVCVHQTSDETKKHVDDARFLRAIVGLGSETRKLINTCTGSAGAKCIGLCKCKARGDPCTDDVQCCSAKCKGFECKGN